MSDRYIAVTGPDEHGRFVAIHPSGMRRPFIYEEDLQALEQHWGIDEARGDALLRVVPKPPKE